MNNSRIAFLDLRTGFKKFEVRSSEKINAFRNKFLENVINYFGIYIKINAYFIMEC